MVEIKESSFVFGMDYNIFYDVLCFFDVFI